MSWTKPEEDLLPEHAEHGWGIFDTMTNRWWHRNGKIVWARKSSASSAWALAFNQALIHKTWGQTPRPAKLKLRDQTRYVVKPIRLVEIQL